MRAIRATRTGGPEVLELVDLPTPRPGSGEALVRVEAAGVNFIDVYHRTGLYPRETPMSLGLEGAGLVEAVGPDVTAVRPGDRVAWTDVVGSYATHLVARAERLVPIPDAVSTEIAAAAMLQGITAHYLTHSTFPLRAGDTCLVHAAAGGVGLLVVQMAKQAGARVFGTTSTEEKAALALRAGADEIIDYARQPFDEAVRRATGGRGVDVVYDSVGASTFEKSLLSLRPRGMLVLFGQSSGMVPPVDLQVLSAHGSLFTTRPTLRHHIATTAELAERAGAVLSAIAARTLDVRIHERWSLARTADAHRALESRRTSGKLLLLPE